MKIFRWFALIVAALALAGCVPELYVWSPDGQRMTVLSDEGLRLADPDGNLQPALIADVHLAVWFPDSKHLLVSKTVDEATWNDLAPQLSDDLIKRVENEAPHVSDFLGAYDWTNPANNSWDKFGNTLYAQELQAGRDAAVLKGYGGVLGLYVRDHIDPAAKQRMPAERWVELAGVKQSVNFIQVVSVDPSGLTPGEILMHTIQGVVDLRMSPTGNAALVVTDSEHDGVEEIWAITADSRHAPVQINGAASRYPDWTSDGRGVAFVRANTIDIPSGQTQLGCLTLATVVDANGDLLDKPKDQQDLAGLIYTNLSRVRCLKDGRIVFATSHVTLPATTGDMAPRAELFYVWPGKEASVGRLLSADASEKIGDSAQYFEISPDETRVSIPDGSGQVTVVELSSGKVQTLPAEMEKNFKLLAIPTWRSSDELTMIVPDAPGHTKVVLWSISSGTEKTLSATWPAKTVPVPKNDNTSQPSGDAAESPPL